MRSDDRSVILWIIMREEVSAFHGIQYQDRTSAVSDQGLVVRKSINTIPRSKINRGFHFAH